jgi:CheY-like chemotaxis protein
MPQTIMIVANDPNITYLLQRYAEESGFRTVSACQGKDVLDLAHHTHPVLIILDTELPGSTGPIMLHGLRTEADTRNIPVVLYSGLEGPTEEWEEEAVAHLPKTVMYDDFVAALKHAGVNHR